MHDCLLTLYSPTYHIALSLLYIYIYICLPPKPKEPKPTQCLYVNESLYIIYTLFFITHCVGA